MHTSKLLLAALFSFAFCLPSRTAQAQIGKEFSAQELIDKLLQIEPILKYKTFKRDFEADIATLTAQPMSAASYQALQEVYDNIKGQFDVFIGMIKQDILDFKNIKKMVKNEGAFVEKYATAFNKAAQIFNNDYPKVVERIKNEGNGTRFIGAGLLLELGKMAFDGIVGWIRNKRIDKDELMSDLLQIVNTSFVDKLKMRPFAAVAAPHRPSNNPTPVPTPAPTPNGGGNNNTGGGGKMKKSAPVSNITEYPATKSLAGSLYLRQPSGDKIYFRSNLAPRTRDLTIGTLNSQQGAAAGVFGSEQAYAAGTQFQIFTQNTGLLYVFAFNSNNTCYPIYPYSPEWVQGFGMQGKMRDLTINPLMLKNDESQILTIPSARADTGEENYITISGNSKKEQLCIILTKSEIDFPAFLQQVQNASGSLSQRLNSVLGDYASGYEKIYMRDGALHYDLNEVEQPIVPIILEIQR